MRSRKITLRDSRAIAAKNFHLKRFLRSFAGFAADMPQHLPSNECAKIIPESTDCTDAMKIAYLLNQHPYPSCTFIRREIAAIEAG